MYLQFSKVNWMIKVFSNSQATVPCAVLQQLRGRAVHKSFSELGTYPSQVDTLFDMHIIFLQFIVICLVVAPWNAVCLSTMCNKWARLASARPVSQGCLFYRVGVGNLACTGRISSLSLYCMDFAEVAQPVLPRPWTDILPVWPSHAVNKIYIICTAYYSTCPSMTDGVELKNSPDIFHCPFLVTTINSGARLPCRIFASLCRNMRPSTTCKRKRTCESQHI